MLTFFERPRTNIKTVRKIAFIFHERQKFMKQSKQKQFVCCDVEKKIDILLAKMTLEEKIGQLNQVGPSAVGGFEISLAEQKKLFDEGRISQEEYQKAIDGTVWDQQEDDIRAGKIGSFLGVIGTEHCNHLQRIAVNESRLGIPLLFGLDVIHGQRTIFPIPLGESCSWDEKLWEETASVAAKEASAQGIHWTFAPMVDIARDARWGRIAEGGGEDPYLTSRMAAAKVKGFQGDHLGEQDKLAACAKHFAAYGGAIGGRDYNSVDISLQTLAEVYLPPFRAAVEAGVATVMPAFNDINGVPCTTNRYLLQEILRKKFGFEGFTVSDANAIMECVNHGTAANRSNAAEQSLLSGVDMDMCSACYIQNLGESVENGSVTMDAIDSAVRHILRIKFVKGLFEHPYAQPHKEKQVLLCAEHRKIARNAAARSVVLLKNNNVLPLKKKMKIALIGELAQNANEMLGTWNLQGHSEDVITLQEGLKQTGADVCYLPCSGPVMAFNRSQLNKVVKGADVIVAAVGELADFSGEASSLSEITVSNSQREMIEAASMYNIPLITILFNGRPLAIPSIIKRSDAVIEAWHLGTETGNALSDILFGVYNPSGRLTTTFPNKSGECPLYYNHTNTGRPISDARFSSKYLDVPLTPLFPFGFGLSYTSYTYHNLQIFQFDSYIEVSVDVKNTGTFAGEETVQLYIHDLVSSRCRPVLELKGYQKIWLEPADVKKVTIRVDYWDLGFYDNEMQYIVEPGTFRIQIGHDSSMGLTGEFKISTDNQIFPSYTK